MLAISAIAPKGAMSALGQKQTFALHQPMSALPPKADIHCDIRLSARAKAMAGFQDSVG